MAKDIKVALTLDNKQFNKALNQSEKKTKQFSKESQKGISGLTKAFGGLVAAIGIGEIISLGDEFTGLTNRLKAVTGSTDEAAEALANVTQIAKDSRSSLSATASLYADLIIATKDLGTSQAEISDITRVFGQTLAISGADASAASGAIRQFGQALASGVLRGDEFNSIAESNSAFMLQLAKALDKPIGALRDLAKEGKLTADVILAATRKMKADVEADFSKTAVTVGQAFTALRNSVIGLFGEIESETGVFEGLASSINTLAKSIGELDVGNLIESFKDLIYYGTLIASIFGAGIIIRGFSLFQAGAIALGGTLAKLGGKIFNVSAITNNFSRAWGNLTRVFKGGGVGGRIGSLGGVISNLGKGFARFIPGIGTAILAFEGLNFVMKKMGFEDFMEKPRTAVIDFAKGLVGIETTAEAAAREIAELAKAEADAAAAAELLIDGVNGTSTATDDAISLVATYADFLKKLNKDILSNVEKEEFRLRAVEELIEAYAKGLRTEEEYIQGMKLLSESLIDVSERLEGATDAVNEFGDDIASSTNDLQKVLDQLNMNAFEKSQDDIRRDLEELRDETLRDLKDELEGLDVVIDATAIDTIKQKMEDVTAATETAILNQQDLGKAGYDASRLFSQGWKDALDEFIDATTDKAAKAKDVLTTFTTGIEDAFVNFAKTGKLSFKDLLDSMVEMFLRSQIQKLMGTLLSTTAGGKFGDFLGSIFGRAQGGPVAGGTPYVVGEKGPELFVPNASGQIVPNNKMGGGGTVNNTYITNAISAVDAKSVAQLFAENRKTLLGTVQMAQKEMPYG